MCCGAEAVRIRPCFSGLFLKATLSTVRCGWFHPLMILMRSFWGLHCASYDASSTVYGEPLFFTYDNADGDNVKVHSSILSLNFHKVGRPCE